MNSGLWDWRAMTAADLEGVLAIERRAFPTPWQAGDFTNGLGAEAQNAANFVVESEAQIVGYCCLGLLGPVVEIQNVAVDPEFRRQGLGRWMLDGVLAHARERGAEALWLEVRRGNEAARALYAAAGFLERGVRPGYYRDTGEDAILLERTLEL